MFFNHPHTLIKNQVLTVASYAAATDCLKKMKHDQMIPDASKPDIKALLKELKHNLRTMYASEFIRHTNSLAKILHMQDEMQDKRENYLRICGQIMDPTAEQRDECQKLFSNYYYVFDTIHGQERSSIVSILRCFVDCCAVQCLQKILASAPESMKTKILQSIFPEAFIDMLHQADDSMIEFMLDAGMKPDSCNTWTNYFRCTTSATLLTSLISAIENRTKYVCSKEYAENGINSFSDKEIKAYKHFLEALLTRKADPDIDEDYPGDNTTPRGVARGIFKSMTENQYLSSEQKDKMSSVLHIIIDAPRVREFTPRTHYYERDFNN